MCHSSYEILQVEVGPRNLSEKGLVGGTICLRMLLWTHNAMGGLFSLFRDSKT
jgi:hypothetical protein